MGFTAFLVDAADPKVAKMQVGCLPGPGGLLLLLLLLGRYRCCWGGGGVSRGVGVAVGGKRPG